MLILCYHAVSEDWSSPLSVTPQALEGQMQFLASKGYTGVTFTEAALEDHPGKVVAVTFDDAYDSVRQLARPILDRYGDPRNDLCAEGGTWERVSQCPGPGSMNGSGGPTSRS